MISIQSFTIKFSPVAEVSNTLTFHCYFVIVQTDFLYPVKLTLTNVAFVVEKRSLMAVNITSGFSFDKQILYSLKII